MIVSIFNIFLSCYLNIKILSANTAEKTKTSISTRNKEAQSSKCFLLRKATNLLH